MKEIAEAEEDGEVGAAVAETLDDVMERNLAGLGLPFVDGKPDGHVTVFVHTEKPVSPGIDAIEGGGLIRRPGILVCRLGGGGAGGRRNHGREERGFSAK